MVQTPAGKSKSCNSISICSYWRARDVPSLSCSLPVGESCFIIIGSESAAEVDALWPENVLADEWMSWSPSEFDTCCLAVCHRHSAPSLAFLSVLSTTAHCPADTSEKQEMLLWKVFIPG